MPRILPKLVREALFVFIDAHANVADPTAPSPLVIELDTLGRQLQQSGAFVLAHDFEHRLEPVSSQFDDGVELLALSPLLWAVPTWCLFPPRGPMLLNVTAQAVFFELAWWSRGRSASDGNAGDGG